MKMDRKSKAEHNPANLKTNHSKSVGKEPEQTFTRDQTAEGQLPSFDEGTLRAQRAQEEAIGSRKRLLATYEHAPIGIIENSPEGNYVNCNEEFCRITGYQKNELLNLTIKDLTYEEDYIFDIKLHQRLVAGDIPFYKLEKRYVRKDGQLIWAEVTRSLMRDADGKPLYTIGAVLDVSGRKQAEAALQQLNLQLESRVQSRTQRLNEVIEVLREEISERKRAEGQLVYQAQLIANVNDAIIATDENLAISYWNQAAEQIYGWKPEEVMGRSATEVLQSEFMDGKTRSEALQKVKEIGELRTAVTHLRKDGTRIFIDAHTSILQNESGKTVGYISINHDVTERTQAEEALHKSRESLRKLSKRLVEVQEDERRAIARELHDRVGQTLAALNINLMIMNGQLLEDSKGRIGSRLDDSMHLVAEAISLVRNVMTDLRPAVLDDYGLEAALQSYIDEYESRYDIKVILDPADQSLPRLGPSVEMTLLRIAQEALTNVARHAQARQVNVSLQLADHSVYLTVQDNGVGIESWQRANQPGSHGMRIMRERAEAFGGILNVGSTPGNGTKVEARIPIGSGGQNKVWEQKG